MKSKRRSKVQSQPRRGPRSRAFVLRATVARDEDVFHAACPALPGCFSWGRTEREALDNLREVARLWIEAKQEVGEPIPVREIDLQGGVTIGSRAVRTITVAA